MNDDDDDGWLSFGARPRPPLLVYNSCTHFGKTLSFSPPPSYAHLKPWRKVSLSPPTTTRLPPAARSTVPESSPLAFPLSPRPCGGEASKQGSPPCLAGVHSSPGVGARCTHTHARARTPILSMLSPLFCPQKAHPPASRRQRASQAPAHRRCRRRRLALCVLSCAAVVPPLPPGFLLHSAGVRHCAKPT